VVSNTEPSSDEPKEVSSGCFNETERKSRVKAAKAANETRPGVDWLDDRVVRMMEILTDGKHPARAAGALDRVYLMLFLDLSNTAELDMEPGDTVADQAVCLI
jgi:hypothetical protein